MSFLSSEFTICFSFSSLQNKRNFNSVKSMIQNLLILKLFVILGVSFLDNFFVVWGRKKVLRFKIVDRFITALCNICSTKEVLSTLGLFSLRESQRSASYSSDSRLAQTVNYRKGEEVVGLTECNEIV